MNKIIVRPLLFLVLLLFICCSSQAEKQEIAAARLESFSIHCGATLYKSVIQQDTKQINLTGITNSKDITNVSYTLSTGATIHPDPQAVSDWKSTQTFTVTGADNHQTVYTVIFPDLKETPEKTKAVVIGYLPLSDFEFDAKYDKIKWKYLTHINTSFARVKADGSLNLTAVQDRIAAVRDKAHSQGVKILISVAKNGKGEFTQAIGSDTSRKALVGNILSFVRTHQLDGFDIDYEEYDNWNAHLPNLLKFVDELHAGKDAGMLMTCAVVSRWLNYTTKWHTYFDYINLMSYDKGSFTENPVQHASYNDYVADINYWLTTNAAPKHKIVGGLPFYGYSWDEGIAVDAIRAIRFCGVINAYGAQAADKDNVNKTYYNGRPTIAKKCRYAVENEIGGVMIWQLFQDAHEDDLQLIEVVGREMSVQ